MSPVPRGVELERPPSPRDVAGHYDDLDALYRAVWGLDVHHGLWRTGRETVEQAVEALAREVLDAARVGPGTRVADVGCGYGATSWRMAGRGAEVVAYTLSAAQARVARARDGRPAGVRAPEVRVADWLENDLPDGSCDAVVSIECLSHVADRARFLAQVSRVLRPGGRAAIAAWLAAESASGLARRALLEPICREGRLAGLATASQLRELAGEAGLRVERDELLGPRVRRTWSVCLGRVLRRIVTGAETRRFLLSASPHRVFALALPRLWLAFRVGAMDYGLFVLERRG